MKTESARTLAAGIATFTLLVGCGEQPITTPSLANPSTKPVASAAAQPSSWVGHWRSPYILAIYDNTPERGLNTATGSHTDFDVMVDM
jgi:hypothetical protein